MADNTAYGRNLDLVRQAQNLQTQLNELAVQVGAIAGRRRPTQYEIDQREPNWERYRAVFEEANNFFSKCSASAQARITETSTSTRELQKLEERLTEINVNDRLKKELKSHELALQKRCSEILGIPFSSRPVPASGTSPWEPSTELMSSLRPLLRLPATENGVRPERLANCLVDLDSRQKRNVDILSTELTDARNQLAQATSANEQKEVDKRALERQLRETKAALASDQKTTDDLKQALGQISSMAERIAELEEKSKYDEAAKAANDSEIQDLLRKLNASPQKSALTVLERRIVEVEEENNALGDRCATLEVGEVSAISDSSTDSTIEKQSRTGGCSGRKTDSSPGPDQRPSSYSEEVRRRFERKQQARRGPSPKAAGKTCRCQ